MKWVMLGGPEATLRNAQAARDAFLRRSTPRVNPLAACDQLAACDGCGQAFVAGTLHDGYCERCYDQTLD